MRTEVSYRWHKCGERGEVAVTLRHARPLAEYGRQLWGHGGCGDESHARQCGVKAQRLLTFLDAADARISPAALRRDFSHCWPPGFDHTRVFWLRKLRTHALLTEPYDHIDEAQAGFERAGWACAIAPSGAGLWYPPHTRAVIGVRAAFADALPELVAALPWTIADRDGPPVKTVKPGEITANSPAPLSGEIGESLFREIHRFTGAHR